MGTTDKNSRLRIIVIILVIFNILTLGTLWYLYINEPETDDRGSGRRKHVQDFMKNRMKFTEEQNNKLNILREGHFESKAMVLDSVYKLKTYVVGEIMKEVTDTAAIAKITTGIGILLGKNELDFALHFIEVKNICSPEQKNKLRQLLMEIIQPRRPDMMGHPPMPPKPGGPMTSGKK